MRLRVSILSVIIHSETVLYSLQNNGELVTCHCKQATRLTRSAKVNRIRDLRQEHIVEYFRKNTVKTITTIF